MAYEKQTWENGDIITAEKLNHIEDGVINAGIKGLFLVIDDDSSTKTATIHASYNDIYDAIEGGASVTFCSFYELSEASEYYMVYSLKGLAYSNDEGTEVYQIILASEGSVLQFTASSPDVDLVATY